MKMKISNVEMTDIDKLLLERTELKRMRHYDHTTLNDVLKREKECLLRPDRQVYEEMKENIEEIDEALKKEKIRSNVFCGVSTLLFGVTACFIPTSFFFLLLCDLCLCGFGKLLANSFRKLELKLSFDIIKSNQIGEMILPKETEQNIKQKKSFHKLKKLWSQTKENFSQLSIKQFPEKKKEFEYLERLQERSVQGLKRDNELLEELDEKLKKYVSTSDRGVTVSSRMVENYSMIPPCQEVNLDKDELAHKVFCKNRTMF